MADTGGSFSAARQQGAKGCLPEAKGEEPKAESYFLSRHPATKLAIAARSHSTRHSWIACQSSAVRTLKNTLTTSAPTTQSTPARKAMTAGVVSPSRSPSEASSVFASSPAGENLSHRHGRPPKIVLSLIDYFRHKGFFFRSFSNRKRITKARYCKDDSYKRAGGEGGRLGGQELR